MGLNPFFFFLLFQVLTPDMHEAAKKSHLIIAGTSCISRGF
jgi:hypothetical protein